MVRAVIHLLVIVENDSGNDQDGFEYISYIINLQFMIPPWVNEKSD